MDRRRIFLILVILLLLVSCQAAAKTPPLTPTAAQPVTQDGAPMVFVPAGPFSMGSDMLDQGPVHSVTLSAYWIDKYEVTLSLWKRCIQAGFCQAPDGTVSRFRADYYSSPAYDNYPVNHVTWTAASAYCTWTGKYLPTEAQWEKAARGTDGRLYPWGNEFDPQKANSIISGIEDTAAVGTFPLGASPYGALDMAGNVWEWTADWYGPYTAGASENPLGPSQGDTKVVRGGGYGVYDAAMMTTHRRNLVPVEQESFLGFRCAK